MVGLVRAHKVRGEQTGERGLLLRALVAKWIDMIDVTARGWLRFSARVREYGSLRFSLDSVRIGKNEMAFVFRPGLQIEKTAGKHVGRHVAVVVAAALAGRSAKNLFMLQPKQRQSFAPLLIAFLAIGDVHAGVAIVVACNIPCEPE